MPEPNLPTTTSATQLTPKETLQTIAGLLKQQQAQFSRALPRHINPEQFLRVAMTTITRSPDLLQCTTNTVLACLMEAAQLGLQVDGTLGEAYLVPFKRTLPNGRKRRECQLIVGYRGYLKLARNSGQVTSVKASVVYHPDKFEVVDGLKPILNHVRSEKPPELKKNETLEAAVRGAYAVYTFRDGSSQFLYMWKWEIDRHRAQSKASESGPWKTHYPEMAEKTVLRRLSHFVPLSSEIQRAVGLEDLADSGKSQDLIPEDLPPDDLGALPEGSGEANGERPGLDGLVDREERARATSTEQRPSATTAPGDNPNYATGADPDPGLTQNLFGGGRGREPGEDDQ